VANDELLLYAAAILPPAVFATAYALTAWVRRYAVERLLDIPNARSSHALPTPRGGGLAIVLAFAMGATALYFLQVLSGPEFAGLLGGGLTVAAIGFLDDHRHVPARYRLLAHVAASIWLLAWRQGWPPANWLEYGATLLFLVWMLNLFNFMDGIDGLAAGETAFIASAASLLLLVGGGAALGHILATVLLGCAAAGFLGWNWPPAKIFMGDAGSGFLGFMTGALAISASSQGKLPLAAWLILAGAFFADASFTLLRRMATGQRWTQAHRSHAYQRAAILYGGHRVVALGFLAIGLFWLLPLATATVYWPKLQYLFLGVAYLPLIFLAYRFDAGRAERSHFL
jgi:Fuc2NAc and GlcNAc transferase